jgi:hypothetical protein
MDKGRKGYYIEGGGGEGTDGPMMSVSTSVHFSLRNDGSSEYICLCEGLESLSTNFQSFQNPRHQFHGIGRLVLETLLSSCYTRTTNKQAEL